jgi:hypothetical protein
VDPHHFDADPDSTYHPDADLNPDYSFKKKAQTLENTGYAKIGSCSIQLGLTSAN